MPAHTPHPQYRVPLTTVSTRIDNAAHTAHRNPADITLLLATKTQPTPTITDAIHTYRHLVTTQQITNRPLAIGENRVQELSNKAADLSSLGLSAHLIGPLQSNKINHTLTALAHHADAWVDSVSTPQLATKLNDRWSHTHPLNVLIQINVSGAPTQHGCPPSDALTLANHIHTLPHLQLRGFMAIGPRTTDQTLLRDSYHSVAAIRDAALAEGHKHATHLSMGMSNDLDIAVECGATIVRVGTAVFGARPPLA